MDAENTYGIRLNPKRAGKLLVGVLKRFRDCREFGAPSLGGFCWAPRERHGCIPLPDSQHPIVLDIWVQNSYAVFCFSQRATLRHRASGRGAMVRAWPAESRWLLAQQRQPSTPAEPVEAPQRPALQEVSPFMWLEREVELEYRPRMLQALPNKVKTVADSLRDQTPACERCRQPMKRQDAEPVSWRARCGVLSATVERYRCPTCQDERRPLPVGLAGGGGAPYAGGAVSLVAVGGAHQCQRGLESRAAVGRVGGPL
jgi:hypothetical protein